jgi:ketosteroid isomerase-like protein
MRSVLCALALLGALIAAGCAKTRAIPTEAADAVDAQTDASLEAANAAFSAAWLAGDVDAIMDAYTDAAVVHPPAGGVLTTPEQIRGVWAPIVNWERAGHRLEPTLRRPLASGLVLEMGRWHSSRNVDGEAAWASGCYTVVWRREGDAWRMEYDGWTAPNDASWACRPR